MPNARHSSLPEANGDRRFYSVNWHEPLVLTPVTLHVFFLVYLVNCIVFYQDRIILDVVYQLNEGLLAKGSFWISLGRPFIQVPPQILPWLVVQLGLSLKAVALAYSVGFCLFHYAMTLALYYGFRRRDLATLFVFIILLYLVHNNFYMNADGTHIIPWALCMLAVLQHPIQSRAGHIGVVLGTALFGLITASSHPFAIPLTLALAGYAFFASDQRRQLISPLAAMVTALVIYYLWKKASMGEYERVRMNMVSLSMLIKSGPSFVRYFMFGHAFALVGMVLLAGMGFFCASYRGRYWFSALCMVGYAAVIASYSPPFNPFYYWHCLMPVYAIMAVSFFDSHSGTRTTRLFSRLFFVAAMLWAVIGTLSDVTELRFRSDFQTNLVNALSHEPDGKYIIEDGQLSRDSLYSFGLGALLEETSTRSALDDRTAFPLLISRSAFDSEHWAFSPESAATHSAYLPWIPLKKETFTPAIVPAPRSQIAKQARQLSLTYPEEPTGRRFVDGWLVNYMRPLRLVYTIPVSLTNLGTAPFPARDTENIPVMFGYYWYRDGKILYENLVAEYLPLNVQTSFQHTLDIRRDNIPSDACLGIDLFIYGRPLIHPKAYDALRPYK